MEKNLSTDKARQGRWGRPVLLVLVAALLLAVLGWFGVAIYGESIDSGAKSGAVTVPAQPATAQPATARTATV